MVWDIFFEMSFKFKQSRIFSDVTLLLPLFPCNYIIIPKKQQKNLVANYFSAVGHSKHSLDMMHPSQNNRIGKN